MSRVLKKYLNKRSESTFKIQITSMVDMFVILLVFLLKSYSTSPVNLTPGEGLQLPQSSSTKDPQDSLKLMVSKTGIFVENEKVVDLVDGEIDASFLDKKDPKFIRKLFEQLNVHAEKSKEIQKVNESFEFDGKVIVQADRALTYDLIKKVLYTSMLAGYADVKFAVATTE